MHRVAADYLSQLTLVHDEVKKSLKGLPAEAAELRASEAERLLRELA
jgi:hypothetical protein